MSRVTAGALPRDKAVLLEQSSGLGFFKTHFELFSGLVFNHSLLVMKSLRCNILPDFPFEMFPYKLHNDVWARWVELET